MNRADEPADSRLVERMSERLVHRGPDDHGLFSHGPIALGHRRLSIIDLEGGHQPMLSHDGRKVIAYNGEIYNFRELRRELELSGHRFRTSSDTEVVLAAYEAHGTDFVSHLDGMFAIAIWDDASRRLVLARDRFGIKPLYLHQTPDRIAFASEIKALLALPEIDRSWDLQALHDYFHFLYVPCPRTAYRSIRQLPPGHLLVVGRGRTHQEAYWELEPAKPLPGRGGAEELMALLQDSVAAHMVSDVPVGCFLSGGIDSGLVAAFMSRKSAGPVRSFTVYDPEVPFYDERERARLVAQRYATDHRELFAKTDPTHLLDLLIPTFDEPFADSGSLPNLVVCRESRQYVTVALSGLGGDELAAGYLRYLGMQIHRALERIPRTLGRWLAGIADQLPEGHGLALDRAKRFVRLAGLDSAEAYTGLLSAGGRLELPVLAGPWLEQVDRSAPKSRIAGCLERAKEHGCDTVNQLLYTDLLTYVPDDLLTLADRTSMRFGLEVRVPFLDPRVVARALAIPGHEKVRRMELKALLRRASRAWLPDAVVRGPKRGFSIPMDAWLRGPLADETTRVVEDAGPATGLLDRAGLRKAWAAHRSGRANHEEILWAAIVFARWAGT